MKLTNQSAAMNAIKPSEIIPDWAINAATNNRKNPIVIVAMWELILIFFMFFSY